MRLEADPTRAPAPATEAKAPLLEVKALKVKFAVGGNHRLSAVDGVELTLRPGEILGLVGESGCGKSVLSHSLLRLIDGPDQITTGEIRWQSRDLMRISQRQMRTVRGQEIAIIFQNAQSALNPVHTVGDQLTAVIRLHRKLATLDAREEALRLFRLVHIPDPERVMNSYPHELSGGMCQRALIAMALSSRPKLLIADEPTASLDVTIQAQIMDLLLEIREQFGMAILLVSHDLGVIARMCDRIAVMYLGRIVELAEAEELYYSPRHPYSQALLRSVPVPDPAHKQPTRVLAGEVPSAIQIPSGCRFRTRCPDVVPGVCEKVDPDLIPVDGLRHFAACVLYDPNHISVAEKLRKTSGATIAAAQWFKQGG